MSWGNDLPVIGGDDDETRKGNAVSDKDTYNVVGSYCKHCNQQDGVHEPGCAQNN